MSNAGQAIVATAAAVATFVITGGNVVATAYAFNIALAASTLLFPTQLPHIFGPKISDLQTTAAQLGTPIPILYGTIAVPGQVIYTGCPREVATTEEVGGKGGPEQEVTTYTYFQTIALGLCEGERATLGEIGGVTRIWENGELKYDNREQQDDEADDAYATRIEASSEYAVGFTLYLGNETQEADPTLEMEMGIGNVPAFRGLAYIVYPNRQLKDEQARRHPIFRFEVFRPSSTGRAVIPPTNLTGDFTTWQTDLLVVDWARNRYFTMDRVGDDGIRAYSIRDNTEISQVAFPGVVVWAGMTIGIDGFIYASYFVAGNTIEIARVDPVTLEKVATAQYSGVSISFLTSFEKAIFVRQYGVENHDWILSGSPVTDDFALFDGSTLLLVDSIGSSQTDVHVCKGARDGVVSYAWAMGWTAALVGDTSPALQLWRITFEEVAAIIPPSPQVIYTATHDVDEFATIAPSDFDPTWTRFTRISGLVFDETDETLIFGVEGATTSGSSLNSGRFVKWNPATRLIVWQTEPGLVDLVNNTDNHNLSELRGSYYAVTTAIQQIALIDVSTGEVTVQDWSDDLPQLTHGEQVFSSAYDAIITFMEAGLGPHVIFLDRRIPGPVSLATIVRDVCVRCDLSEDDIDVADLEDRYVLGYAIAASVPGRGAIEPLRQVGYFDGVESEGLLKFPVRGKALVHTLTEAELGAHESAAADDNTPPAVTTRKAQDVELPLRVRIKYIAPSRDYEPGETLSPSRFTSESINEINVELPIALTDEHASQAAEVLWADAWASRWTHEIALDTEFLYLDPADAVGVPVDGRIYRARIVEINDAGGILRNLQLARDDDGAYVSNAVADLPAQSPTTVIVYGQVLLLLLDLPALRDEDDDAGFYAATYRQDAARTWAGALIQRSIDSGATFATVATVANEAIVGQLVEDLPAGISSTWDFENEIVISLLSGTLESRTEEAVLNGANALAIRSGDGWEIVQFLDAVQETPTQWRASTLLRGRRGTEYRIGFSVAGDSVVLISGPGIVRVPMQTSEIGSERQYRAIAVGTIASAATIQTFVGTGEALEPFSPVEIEGERDPITGDLTITWIRRGRIGQELPDGADVPLSEETESYEVDVINPGSPTGGIRRTIATSTQSAIYTAAQQLADGFSSGELVPVAVYQLSATVGRGTPGEATI